MKHKYIIKKWEELPRIYYFKSYVIPMIGLGETDELTCYQVKIPKNILIDQAYHKHASEMVWVIAGAGFALLGEDKIRVQKGDVIFVPPPTPHGFRSGPQGMTLFTALSGRVDSKTDFYWSDRNKPHEPPKVISGEWFQGKKMHR